MRRTYTSGGAQRRVLEEVNQRVSHCLSLHSRFFSVNREAIAEYEGDHRCRQISDWDEMDICGPTASEEDSVKLFMLMANLCSVAVGQLFQDYKSLSGIISDPV